MKGAEVTSELQEQLVHARHGVVYEWHDQAMARAVSVLQQSRQQPSKVVVMR